jgi:hypothetical protein
MPNILKSGSLNFLEASRSVQACNGIALLFDYTIITDTPVPCSQSPYKSSDVDKSNNFLYKLHKKIVMPHLLQSYFGQIRLRLDEKASIKIHKLLYMEYTGCHNKKFHLASVCMLLSH